MCRAVTWCSSRDNDDNNKEPFLIMDARPKINAVTNKAKGKGYETSKTYENCQVLFMGIENIHVMRESLNQVVRALHSFVVCLCVKEEIYNDE